MFLEWDEKYSVKVKRLDDQHKILFNIINDVSEAMDAGEGNQVLGDILDSMASYSKVHFFSEEKFMQDCDYPDLDKHKKEHQYFVTRVQGFKKNLEDEKNALSKDVIDFLKTWLTEHILVKDAKYSTFLNEKGIT